MAVKGVLLVLVVLMMSATVFGAGEVACIRNCEKNCPTHPPTAKCASDCAIDCQHAAPKLKLRCFFKNCTKFENDTDGFQKCLKVCSS
ncbi:hypothetical protein SLE2022_283450 [Rubroshorea leprosula]